MAFHPLSFTVDFAFKMACATMHLLTSSPFKKLLGFRN